MASILVRRIPAEIKSDVIALANLEKRMRKLQRAVSRKRDKLIRQILFGGVQVPDTLWMTLLSDPKRKEWEQRGQR